MKRSLYCLCLLVLVSSTFCFGQVSLQTGAAQLSIPLYSYSDPANRLGLNASLVYVDGGGLKVSEMASAVGTGWMLDCGGQIDRIQHGEPDDQKSINSYPYDANVTDYFNYVSYFYPDGYLYSSYSPFDIIDNGGSYAPYESALPFPLGNKDFFKPQPVYSADREQDVFNFSFNGRNGQFVIGKNWQVRTIGDSKLKIDVQQSDMSSSGVRTRISQFTITDESGIQYVFNDMKLDNVCTYNDVRYVILGDSYDLTTLESFYTPMPIRSNAPGYASGNMNVVFARPTSQYVINRWYLSRIVNPFTGKSITFNYSQFSENKNADLQIEYPRINGEGNFTIYWQQYMTQDKRVSSVILSPAERIDFNYDANPRIDLPNQNSLDQIKVSYNNNPVYSWNFGYGYFTSTPNTSTSSVIMSPADINGDDGETRMARLALLTLQRTGSSSTSEPPYKFTYNLGGDNGGPRSDVVPPMFSIHQDHWGYYNSTFPITERFINGFYTYSELSQLVGTSPPVSPPGFFKYPVSTMAKNGIIKSVTYPLGGVLSFNYEANVINNPQTQVGGVRVNSTTQYDGIDHGNDIVKQYKYLNADESTSSGWGAEVYSYSYPMPIYAPAPPSATGPSFGVKDIATNYIQNGFMTGSFGLSSAPAFGAALGSAVDGAVIGVAVYVLMELFVSGPSYNPNQSSLIIRNTSTVVNNPLLNEYARTEVIDMLGSGTVGKTVYEFSTPVNHPIEVPALSVMFSDRPRYAPWVYGQPLTITVYDKDNHIKKQTINHYSYIVNQLNDPNFASKSWASTQANYGNTLLPPTITGNYIQQEVYYPLTGHTQLDYTDVLTYNAQQNSNIVTTHYEYDNNFQLKHQYSANSKTEEVETYYYHPYDYNTASGNAIAVMNNPANNIVSPVLSTESYIHKSDGVYLLGGTSTDYTLSSNNDIKPKTTYTFQSALPIASTSLQPFNTAGVLRDPTYFKQVAVYDYDDVGNAVQTLTGGNKVVSNIYGYDGKLVIASANNASYTDIGYTSFEGEGNKPGAWLNTAAIFSDDARTGATCFNLSDPSNTAANYFGFSGFNTGLTYIVSFWAKNGSVCLNGSAGGTNTVSTCQGSSGWTQGVNIGGWVYYEKQISGIDKISISGTGLIDEFRIYPVGAQMTTTTYKPKIGKTSECDVSGRVLYYFYDDLGRLIKVSDDQRNVIKTYEYNYKQ